MGEGANLRLIPSASERLEPLLSALSTKRGIEGQAICLTPFGLFRGVVGDLGETTVAIPA